MYKGYVGSKLERGPQDCMRFWNAACVIQGRFSKIWHVSRKLVILAVRVIERDVGELSLPCTSVCRLVCMYVPMQISHRRHINIHAHVHDVV